MTGSGGQVIIESVNPDRGAPGTRVTIRGQNFGESAEEFLSLSIGKHILTDFATWHSSTKVTVITNIKVVESGYVIITNKMNQGKSPEMFVGYMPSIGPTTEIGGWTEENFTIISEEKIEEIENDDILGIEKAKQKYPPELLSQFKDVSSNIHSSNFSPEFFIIESFYDKKRDDFFKALSTLNKTKSTGNEQGFQVFLQKNIGQIFRSLDMFSRMLTIIVKNNTSRGMKTKLLEFIEVANQESDYLFESTTSKRGEIEKVRNSMQVFKSYLDLFTLPDTLEKHFALGEFLDCATAFTTVKEKYPVAPFASAKFSIEKSEEIVNRITSAIESRLSVLPRPFEELKQMTLYLNTVRKSEDAFLETVSNFKDFIVLQLSDEYTKYVKMENSFVFKTKNIPEYFEFKKFLFTVVENKIKDTESYSQKLMKCGLPPNIEMIEKICYKMSLYFSQFWKICSFCLSQINHRSSASQLQNQIINKVQEIIILFISLINSVVRPDDEKSATNLQFLKIKWEGKFLRRIQLWLPFIISRLEDMVESLSEVDPSILQQITSLIINIKAICAIKLSKLSSQLIKSVNLMCDPSLLRMSENETYSIFVEYYLMMSTNASKVLKICFKSKDNKSSIFFSTLRDKIDEAISSLLSSILVPLSLLHDQVENPECLKYEFSYSKGNFIYKNSFELRMVIVLSSLNQSRNILENVLKPLFLESGLKNDDNFTFVISEINNRFETLKQNFCSRFVQHIIQIIIDSFNSRDKNEIKSKYCEFVLLNIFSYICLIFGQLKTISHSIYNEITNDAISLLSSSIKDDGQLNLAISDNKSVYLVIFCLSLLISKINAASSSAIFNDNFSSSLNESDKEIVNVLITTTEKNMIFSSLSKL